MNFHILKLSCLCFISVMLSLCSYAQNVDKTFTSINLKAVQKKYGLDPSKALMKRIDETPESVLKMFRDAEMNPTEHRLTKEEESIVASAIAALPPLHRRVLKQHLKSISFLDNMPNTALTSPITNNDGVDLYHITFRAGILHQSISEWITEKENTCFSACDPTITISIQAGLLKALTYVFMHEGTHVVDGSINLISADSIGGKPHMNEFTRQFSNRIWKNINNIIWPVRDSLVLKSRFRLGGERFSNSDALKVYAELVNTPFTSLYSTASWHEDLAELLTVYHLTSVRHQPFRIIIRQSGKIVNLFEPMKSALVLSRLKLLSRFYSNA
ncbi:MAG: hypothetical protein JKY70_13035 [Mucilaginibacter sp.]|nr:hypothetical protein [Mucilaginibacter sp.]